MGNVKFLLVITLAMTAFMSPFIAAIELFDYYTKSSVCEAYQDKTELQTSYSYWAGCFVEMPDGQKVEKQVVALLLQKHYEIVLKKESHQ